MLPADEGFDRRDGPGPQVDDRLIMHTKLVSSDGAAQVDVELFADIGGNPFRGCIHPVPALARLFRRVHREIGVADQPLGIEAG